MTHLSGSRKPGVADPSALVLPLPTSLPCSGTAPDDDACDGVPRAAREEVACAEEALSLGQPLLLLLLLLHLRLQPLLQPGSAAALERGGPT